MVCIMSLRPKVGVVGLDLLFMGVNFSALTLFSTLSPLIASDLGMGEGELRWAAAAYSIGIFAAFFLGHSRFTEEHPRATVAIAAVFASAPQFLIPMAPNALVASALRFLQGLVMMAVPIFSSQVGKLFSSARPFALGTILSGIFIGGLVGSTAGWQAAMILGWRGAYAFFGILMLAAAGVWVALTPSWSLPEHKRVKKAETAEGLSVWRHKFTWVWGFTFFPSIWVIFTLAPLIHFIVSSQAPGYGKVASEVLEGSYAIWSIAIGGVAYALAKRSSETPRDLFKAFATVQAACFVASLAGAAISYITGDVTTLLAALILVAVIQGTAPTFWSMPSTAYSREVVTKAGYALGLISNSAALIGPVASIMISALSPQGMWLMVIALTAFGAALTLAALRIKMPVEEK